MNGGRLRVIALHPHSGELEEAFLLPDHFGVGKSAIWFGYTNSPYFAADEVEWEPEPVTIDT